MIQYMKPIIKTHVVQILLLECNGWDQAAVRYVYKANVFDMKNNMFISKDTNLNNNCHPKNIGEYIENGGYIIHLTTFNGTYKPRDMKTVKRFKSILGLD